jgi:hypothetical protein
MYPAIESFSIGRKICHCMAGRERRMEPDSVRDSETPTIAWNPLAERLAVAWIERGLEGNFSIVLRTSENTSVQEWILHQ